MEETKSNHNHSLPEMVKTQGRPILLTLVFLILLEGFVIFYFYARFRSQARINTSLRQNLENASLALEEQITETARRREDLNRLREEHLKIKEIKNRLEKSLNDKKMVIANLEKRLNASLQSEEVTREEIKRKEQIAVYLRKRLKEGKGVEMQLMERLEGILKKKVELENRIVNLKETLSGQGTQTAGIPLEETVVAMPSAKISEIRGQILIANNKYAFIIVNLGSDDGVSKGDNLSIERDSEEIGVAKVKKLYKKMCLADVVSGSKRGNVKKNLIVRLVRTPDKETS